MRCDECGSMLYQADEVVSAGTYLRVDDGSFRQIVLDRPGSLPATFDGHIAEYRVAGTSCACARRLAPHAHAAPAAQAAPAAKRKSPISL